MTYTPLARKYRPATFEDLVGQEAVVRTLANAIQLKREPHALLFTGTRGVGKTTTARLYAKALNCQSGPTDKPCNTCASCVAINKSCHEDVSEIDGASHTGVDAIRELQNQLSYVPQRSSFRIIIIDEVHMLSQSAFNALLKTLEEPPGHVVFIFATTELNKVPGTILSRCQLFYLKAITLEGIIKRLSDILDSESIVYESQAIRLVAEQGKGSMRDALTFLDQVIALGSGQVDVESLKGLISNVDGSNITAFIEALLQRQPKSLIEMITQFDQSGIPYAVIVEECLRFCRHSMVCKEVGFDSVGLSILPDEMVCIQKIVEACELCPPLELNRIFRNLANCLREMNGSNLDRFILENTVLEWCLDPGFPDILEWDSGVINGSVTSRKRLPPSETVQDSESHKGHKAKSLPSHKKRNLLEDFQSARAQPPTANPSIPSAPAQSSPSSVPEIVAARQPEFPESWQALIEQFRESQPLEARILEECFLVTYNKHQIVLASSGSALEKSRLLEPADQQALGVQLKKMFGFKGSFSVVRKEEEPIGETLFQKRQKETKLSEDRVIRDSQEHPLTQHAISLFNAKIESVELLRE